MIRFTVRENVQGAAVEHTIELEIEDWSPAADIEPILIAFSALVSASGRTLVASGSHGDAT